MRILISMASSGLLVMLGACSNTPVDTAPKSPVTTPNTASAGSPSAAGAANGMSQTTMRVSALPPDLAKDHSVFFGFDDVTIAPEYLGVVEKHGKYLATLPAMKIKIEGNADERGSPEYNLALGQKRAEATMKALKLMGVRESQMEPVSWGEERPQDKGHDDTAYSHNRRADIVYSKL